jgi:hypothetical protein
MSVARPEIFLSYAERDGDRASEVARLLRAGGARPRLAREAVGAGEDFVSWIETHLTRSDWLLLLWSSSARQSYWVTLEWHAALRREDYERRPFLFLGRLDSTQPPLLVSTRLTVNLYPTAGRGVQSLLQAWRRDRSAEVVHQAPVRQARAMLGKGAEIYIHSRTFSCVALTRLDLRLTAGQALAELVERWQLPKPGSGEAGSPVRYHLTRADRIIPAGRSLSDAGVRQGDVLGMAFARYHDDGDRVEILRHCGEADDMPVPQLTERLRELGLA